MASQLHHSIAAVTQRSEHVTYRCSH